MPLFFGDGAQRALPVGPNMADSLFALPPNIVNKELTWGNVTIPVERARKLGLRNILRDRSAIQVRSGQQVARFLGLPELAPPKELADAHISKTPLWFYCLQEAGECGQGKLTGVGGTIVASVFARLLKLDMESVYHIHDFKPWHGFGEKRFSMAALMTYVDENLESIEYPEKLYCGPAHLADEASGPTSIAAE